MWNIWGYYTQCTATLCNTLQHFTTHCNTLRYSAIWISPEAVVVGGGKWAAPLEVEELRLLPTSVPAPTDDISWVSRHSSRWEHPHRMPRKPPWMLFRLACAGRVSAPITSWSDTWCVAVYCRCIAVCCSVWQCVTVCCSVLHFRLAWVGRVSTPITFLSVASYALQHTTIYYNILQHSAAHCNTLQHSATHQTTVIRFI